LGLERNCGTQFCIDLQTALELRTEEFYLVRGEKLDESGEPGLSSTIVKRRWRGRLLINGAESCEVESEERVWEKSGTGTTYTSYECLLGRNLSRAQATARYHQVKADIRAALPSNAKVGDPPRSHDVFSRTHPFIGMGLEYHR